ncbi:hypothetical protein AC482_03605 [miscellaneous Crenarchaeota group-15 archaeon DG-45]|uniref:IPT/TIG domain-containing protein n=1 Tax=miscellaneous Crenarchaeota group-15 archaeon DG-45 TaxID=1685127 RepID=A0A0M0BQ39_9ARCH|nr:MAG: hypothetical protein AC482_03605 [miscellaneous Crenarchaeota group-15 archaeon DG-45]
MSKLTKRAVPILILAVLALSFIPAVMQVMAITVKLSNRKTPWVGLAEGDKGDTVEVTGAVGEIPAGSKIILYWDSIKAWDGTAGKLNETTAKSSGNYEVWFKVPEAKAGSHYIWIYSESLETQSSGAFIVHPLIKLSAESGLVDDDVTVTGYGFAGSKDVAIMFGPDAAWTTWDVTSELDEDTGEVGDGAEKVFEGTLDYKAIKPGTVVIDDGVETFDDTPGADGDLDGSAGGTGTINYVTGEFKVTFNTAPLALATIEADYDWYEDVTPGVVGPVYVLSTTPDTNSVGTFTKKITIPSESAGDYRIVAYDGKGNVDYNLFTIGAVITLTPELDSVGSVIRVKGRGFSANEHIDTTNVNSYVELWRGGAMVDDCYIIDEPIAIGSNKEFRMDIVIPQSPKVDDDYEIRVADTLGVSAVADFEVTGLAEIEVEPEFGAQGETVTIRGYNFTKISGKEVTVTLGGLDVGIEPETDSNGYFEDEFVVLGAAGVQTLEAEMATYNIAADEQFKVGLMIVTLSPAKGPTGKLITIFGSGFSAGGKWNATFGDMVLFEDESVQVGGVFDDTFYVPTVPVGTYKISVMDMEEDIEVTSNFEVTYTTLLTVDPTSAPNRGPTYDQFNVTIEGKYFLYKAGEPVEFVLYNVTAGGSVDEDWDMEVYQNIGGVETAVTTNKDGEFEAWWMCFDNNTLGLGDYIINATQTGPDDEEIIYQIHFTVIPASMAISPRKVMYRIGDTVAFNIESSWKETGSYLKIKDTDGTLYWQTDDLNTWVKVGSMRVAPYYSQTAGGNLMILSSDAPLGAWTWTWYDVKDKVLDSGTFEVLAAAEAVLEGRIDELAGDIADVKTDIAGVKTDISGVKSDVAGAKAAADAAKAAADSAKTAVSDAASKADSAKTAADAAKTSADAAKTAANEAKSAAGGLSSLVYGAIGASIVAALAAIAALMQISRRIAG